MREIVLAEEPLCRICLKEGRTAETKVADHIRPKAEGGTDDRSNYQGLCTPCSDAKTREEAARARGARPPRRTVEIGLDGWPIDPAEGGAQKMGRPRR